jgi:hypothetical protein
VRREIAVLGETQANLGVVVDKMAGRLDRVEHRLDILLAG